jgi:hypothetical protein
VRAAARGQRMGLRAMFGLGGGEKKAFPVQKTEDEWRQTLGSAEYRVLRKVRLL